MTPCAWEGANTSLPANPKPNAFTHYSVVQVTPYFVMIAATFAVFHLGPHLLVAASSVSSLTRQ